MLEIPLGSFGELRVNIGYEWIARRPGVSGFTYICAGYQYRKDGVGEP